MSAQGLPGSGDALEELRDRYDRVLKAIAALSNAHAALEALDRRDYDEKAMRFSGSGSSLLADAIENERRSMRVRATLLDDSIEKAVS